MYYHLQDPAFLYISLLNLRCVDSLYFKPSTLVSSLNPASMANVNADMATVFRITLIHEIWHASKQSTYLTLWTRQDIGVEEIVHGG